MYGFSKLQNHDAVVVKKIHYEMFGFHNICNLKTTSNKTNYSKNSENSTYIELSIIKFKRLLYR